MIRAQLLTHGVERPVASGEEEAVPLGKLEQQLALALVGDRGGGQDPLAGGGTHVGDVQVETPVVVDICPRGAHAVAVVGDSGGRMPKCLHVTQVRPGMRRAVGK